MKSFDRLASFILPMSFAALALPPSPPAPPPQCCPGVVHVAPAWCDLRWVDCRYPICIYDRPLWASCLCGPDTEFHPEAGCPQRFDYDRDGDVDLADYAEYQRGVRWGPGQCVRDCTTSGIDTNGGL